jgi:hypothetical protein
MTIFCVVGYVGNDYPHVWDVGDLKDALIPLEPTTHYQLSTPQADVEWEALAPNDGIIYLGPDHRPFSISHFHQMRCLNVLRKQLVSHRETPNSTDIDTPLSRHCYNYLREMVLCRSTTALDPVFGRPRPATVVEYRDDSTCRDWNKVYEEAWRNVEEYSRWKVNEVRVRAVLVIALVVLILLSY